MPPAEAPSVADTSRRLALAGWCIRHPIGTTLLALGVLLLGIVAFPRMPLAPVPEIDLPTIQISASLPGASAETMASSVATPLEVQLAGVSGISEMTSSSTLGSTGITIQFDLGKDIDVAAQEVQAAINVAGRQLPREMPNPPVWRKGNPNDSPIFALRMQSELLTLPQLGDLAEVVVARRISQVSGVAEVNVYGLRRPAIRVQVSPEKAAALGLSLSDLREVLRGASVNRAKGAIQGAERVSTIAANDQIFDPAEYGALVVAYRGGAPVFLRDVATVTLGSENDFVGSWQNGRPGMYIVVRRQPGENIVAVARAVQAALPAIRAALPANVELEVLNDRTRTIRSTLHEAEVTLALTFALVVLVMGAFLRQTAATAIVACVLALALVATVAAMYLLGFSFNNLTIVGLILAVGFVVDDAIVVVENIHRRLEAGASMRDAATEGAAEIAPTVVAISLALVAAFIPLLFMGGVVGRLFREFAGTLTAAILFSMLAALTLGPMLASRFMRPHAAATRAAAPSQLLGLYARGLAYALARPRGTLGVFFATLAAAVVGYVLVPKGFFPLQDTAYVVGSTRAADDVSYPDMVEKHRQLAGLIGRDPAILSLAYVVGATGPNPNLANGRFYLSLKDRSDRDVSSEELIDRLRPLAAQVPGIHLVLRTQQDINLGGRGSRSQYQYVLRGAESTQLATWAGRLAERLGSLPEFRDVSNELQLGAAVTRLTIDRAAAARYGLRVEDVSELLYDAYGQRQVGEYQTEVGQYRIVLEADARQRARVGSLENLWLRSPTGGAMVPLAAVARLEPAGVGPLSITHDGLFPSAAISFNLRAGVALGDAVALVERATVELGLPSGIEGDFRGSARAFQDALATQPWLILAAVLAVYIILGVLYESFAHPLTILSTLPSAGVGAILALRAAGQDFSVMALMGVILLIGLVMKNGILLVDFALERQRAGMAAVEAIREACLVRFRPIVMTTIAAMLGAIPLMAGFGTGAELRQPLGIAVFGGLAISQLLTLFTTPVVYLALDRLAARERGAGLPAPAVPS